MLSFGVIIVQESIHLSPYMPLLTIEGLHQCIFLLCGISMCPPRYKLFLWLLSHNKLAIVDNLNKNGMQKPELCMLCEEKESINHMFFDCCVAKAVWKYACEFMGMSIGSDYVSIPTRWLNKKRYDAVNIISTVVLRGIWLTQNDFVFNNQSWSVVKLVLRRIWKLSVEWQILCKDSTMETMKKWLIFLEQQFREPMRITRD
jgi:hypothetical protein